MAITKAFVSGSEAVAEWLNANAKAFFSSVTSPGGGVAFEAKDENEDIVCTVVIGYYRFRAYRAANNFIEMGNSGDIDPFVNTTIIMCDNGIILDASYDSSHRFAVLFAKTNSGKLAVVSNGLSKSNCYTGINHVALGDSATLSSTTTFTPESGQQTMLVPFATNANIGDVSYTPNAYYLPMNSNYNSGIGKFSIGSDIYITNGYWAIKDS